MSDISQYIQFITFRNLQTLLTSELLKFPISCLWNCFHSVLCHQTILVSNLVKLNAWIPIFVFNNLVYSFVQRMFTISSHLSLLSDVFFSFSTKSPVGSKCNFSTPPSRLLQHMQVKGPTFENSDDPSSTSLFFWPRLRNLQKDLSFSCFVANSVAFFSCCNS
jgi:hypothetical protein